MDDPIFLSAGVPDPKRGPEFAATANTIAITAAVTALVHVTLGRRLLVWGGQPAITPMIWAVAEDMGIDYGAWVKLYQTLHFKDEFPDENAKFGNVVFTNDIEKDPEKSLLVMRERMFSEQKFHAAVFIGGMKGIVKEYELFKQMQPQAALVPVVSAGGATIEVANQIGAVDVDLVTDLDYVALFHRHLGISEREERFRSPADQPASQSDRFWTRPSVGLIEDSGE
jgi:hypothetical protein